MIGLFCSTGIVNNHKIIIRNWFRSMINILGPENVVVFYNGNSNRFKNLINIKEARYECIYVDDNEDWKDYINKCKKVFKKNKIDTLINFRMTMVRTATGDNYYLYEHFDELYNNKQYDCGLNYVITKQLLSKYAVLKSANDLGIKLIQFMTDPQESNMIKYFNNPGCRAYILNKTNLDNTYYMPSCEYEYLSNIINIPKELDFVFYGTAITDDRNYLINDIEKLKKIKNSDVQVITSVKNGTNKCIPQDKYLELIAKSKYTLVIPSYDKTTFSSLRFFEAIQRKCLPLILDTCNLTDIKNTYPNLYKIIKKYLIVDFKSINSTIKSLDREDILNKIYDCKDVKQLQDIDYCRNAWLNIL